MKNNYHTQKIITALLTGVALVAALPAPGQHPAGAEHAVRLTEAGSSLSPAPRPQAVAAFGSFHAGPSAVNHQSFAFAPTAEAGLGHFGQDGSAASFQTLRSGADHLASGSCYGLPVPVRGLGRLQA